MTVAPGQPLTTRPSIHQALGADAPAGVTAAADPIVAPGSPVAGTPSADAFKSGAAQPPKETGDEAAGRATSLRASRRSSRYGHGHASDAASPAAVASSAAAGASGTAAGASGAASSNAAPAATTVTEPSGPAAPNGTIEVGGVTIPRRAPVPTPLNSEQQAALNAFTKQSLGLPPGLTDWRTADVANQAATAPPVVGADGKPVSLGDLAIFRVGGANVAPSAAQIFRIALHAGKTVVAYQNTSDPSKNQLRPLTEIQGVPVPTELRGKIFGIGEPDNRVWISYDQASDGFVEQFAQLERQKEMLGLDPLHAKATVFGNSMASQDGVLTRDRLEKAGFPDAIGKFIPISGGWHGPAPSGLKLLSRGMLAAVETLGPAPDGKLAAETFEDEAKAKRDFPPEMERHIDLSVASVIGPPPSIEPRFGWPPIEVRNNNIRPGMRAAASGSGLLDGLHDLSDTLLGGDFSSDGLVPTELSRWGKRFLLLDQYHDHAGIIEDPAVMDRIIQELGK